RQSSTSLNQPRTPSLPRNRFSSSSCKGRRPHSLLRNGPATSRRKRCSETPDIAYLFLIVVRRRLRELTSPAQSGLGRFLTDKAQLGHIQPPTNASITRQIWVRTNQFVQRPCSRASPRMYIMWAAFLLSKLLHALYTIFTPSYRQVLLIRAATTSKI